MMDRTRISNNNRMVGNIEINKAVGGNHHIIPYSDTADDRCVYPNPYTVAQNGRTTALSSIFCTDGTSFVQIYIVP